MVALFTVQVLVAQNASNQNPIEQNIEGLSIYPNPVDHEQNIINIIYIVFVFFNIFI